MDIDRLDKNESIKALVARLNDMLGEDYFDIVDHWKDDLYAIGIGCPTNSKILVYISTFGNEEGLYDVHLELPPSENDDFPYTDAGQFNSVDSEKLIELVRDHLGKGST